MVASSIYLFIGQDQVSKDRKIAAIKKTIFKHRIEEFNFESFYGKELGLCELKESLNRLPIDADKRLVVIKNIEYLSAPQKTYLVSFLKKPFQHIILILETSHLDTKDAFITSILGLIQVYRFRTSRATNVFDLGRAISQAKTVSALNILSRLVNQQEKATRLLGGLFWQWQRDKGRLSAVEQKRQLKIFLDTDIDIKTGKLKPELALELLVINLCRRVS